MLRAWAICLLLLAGCAGPAAKTASPRESSATGAQVVLVGPDAVTFEDPDLRWVTVSYWAPPAGTEHRIRLDFDITGTRLLGPHFSFSTIHFLDPGTGVSHWRDAWLSSGAAGNQPTGHVEALGEEVDAPAVEPADAEGGTSSGMWAIGAKDISSARDAMGASGPLLVQVIYVFREGGDQVVKVTAMNVTAYVETGTDADLYFATYADFESTAQVSSGSVVLGYDSVLRHTFPQERTTAFVFWPDTQIRQSEVGSLHETRAWVVDPQGARRPVTGFYVSPADPAGEWTFEVEAHGNDIFGSRPILFAATFDVIIPPVTA